MELSVHHGGRRTPAPACTSCGKGRRGQSECEVLAAARHDRRPAVIYGAAGVGKSRLADEVVRAGGGRLLRFAATVGYQALPFGVLLPYLPPRFDVVEVRHLADSADCLLAVTPTRAVYVYDLEGRAVPNNQMEKLLRAAVGRL